MDPKSMDVTADRSADCISLQKLTDGPMCGPSIASPVTKEVRPTDARCRAQEVREDTDHTSGTPFAIVYLTVLLTTFVIAFDSTCVVTIVPVLTDEFKSLNDVGWYGTAYLISSAATILIYGKIYRLFPVKRIYLFALGVYIAGSVVCATANSSLAFIIGRAVAGLGAAGLTSGGKVFVARTLPLRKRPLYQGFISGLECLAISVGPIIGGAVTIVSSWRVVFYISVPIGSLNGLSLLFFGSIPDDPGQEETGRFAKLRALDLSGLMLFVPAILCLLLALSWAGSQYSWNDSNVVVTLTLASVLFVLFALVQWYKQDAATIPPRIICQRTVLSGCIFSFCTSGSLFVLLFYLPIYFQAIKRVNILDSGIMTLPLAIGLVISETGAGFITHSIGYYTPCAIASVVLASISSGLISTLQATSNTATWVIFQLLAGLGCGIGFQQPYIAVQTVVSAPDIPTALVIVGFVQRMGNIVCLAVAQQIFTSHLSSSLTRTVPGLNPGIVSNTGATSLWTDIPQEYSSLVLEAYGRAVDSTFYIAVIGSCIAALGALGMEWRSVKGNNRTA